MFEYFIFIIIKSTVYKELDTLKLIDKVEANNTKQALMKAEENLVDIDSSKIIVWNSARIGSYCKKGNIEDVMIGITDELKAIAHGRHPKCFE